MESTPCDHGTTVRYWNDWTILAQTKIDRQINLVKEPLAYRSGIDNHLVSSMLLDGTSSSV